jgi:DNA mismatch repair protein MSH6
MDEDEHNVTFLYKLTSGICEKSFGMNVAMMAGIPSDVVTRATTIAEEVEVTHKLKDTTYAMAVDGEDNNTLIITPAVIADLSYLLSNKTNKMSTDRILHSFKKLIN